MMGCFEGVSGFEGVLGVACSWGRGFDLTGGSEVVVRMCCKLCLGSGWSDLGDLGELGDKLGCPFVFASGLPSTFRLRIRLSGERGPKSFVPCLAGAGSKAAAAAVAMC